MKKFMFVICLTLTALPVFANGVGEVGTDCASMAQDSRREVVETQAPAQSETVIESSTAIDR